MPHERHEDTCANDGLQARSKTASPTVSALLVQVYLLMATQKHATSVQDTHTLSTEGKTAQKNQEWLLLLTT